MKVSNKQLTGTEKNCQMKNKTEIRLSKPSIKNKRKIISLFDEILNNGYLIQGKYVSLLEKRFCEFLRIKNAVAVSSGTAALHLSLIASGVKHGDEVIVPAYTFPATANVVELVGAKTVIVDVDIDTYNINPVLIEENITNKTKAIIAVHIFGNPANMRGIMKIARKYGLYVIEDAAGALGSEFENRKCGTIGHIGCFSFHPRKLITTGEGGMVVTNNSDLAEKIQILRNHGFKKNYPRPEIMLPGFNYRMNELEAIIGISQIDGIKNIIEERRKLARFYMEALSEIKLIKFQKILKNCKHSWQAFIIRLKNIDNIDEISEKMKKRGVEITFGTYAIHLLSYYAKKYQLKPSDFPNAASLYKSAIAIPFYNGISKEDIKRVVESLKEILL
ncbi:MAG: DegT/DnrJ/EryC1/StrS family aminotransferase [bacterium]|nr:DegT/DnrJ/EryC1/StrS family aminotransferase [bacterium]